ncbi:diamine acetyltransferase 2-like isoform X3 [Terrapene carolina triunguis]|uniref:diamine acetyltransferase 2-like isoform X3 n=1 Tax=Terrapene triunguis TaxID=2587831 RepID=UPI000CEF8419|nr:diamine acetyltransferase 2-like isoform X3 [Terrapene carolina triunguis]
MECVLRPCRAEDCAEVMRMIKELAEFEKLPDQVQISDQVLREDGFANDPFYRCLVAEVPPEHRSRDGHTVVGYGLYFFTYSTWKGRNIYMEDLYVMPEFRDGDPEVVTFQADNLSRPHLISEAALLLYEDCESRTPNPEVLTNWRRGWRRPT